MVSIVMVRVAYQGIAGSYSEMACFALFPGKHHSLVPLTNFTEVFVALQEGTSDYGVVPIENSLGGSIHLNYDLLEEYPVDIIREYNLRIQHCLLGIPGSSVQTVEQVCSHPQALHQCRHQMTQLNLHGVSEQDTAGSAQLVAQRGDVTQAAIASARAGKLYGLTILQDNFADTSNNFTRFLVIKRKANVVAPETQLNCSEIAQQNLALTGDKLPGGQLPGGQLPEGQLPEGQLLYKTSIVIGFNNSVGALHQVLTYFSLQRLDLTKIESRPDISLVNPDAKPDNPFQYKFYLDFVSDNTNQRQVLHNLIGVVSHLKVLGSYPTDSTIHLPITEPSQNRRLGIIGFGNFGQFVAKFFSKYFQISVTSRTDYTQLANSHGYNFYPNMADLVGSGVDYLVICVSISSFQTVVNKLVETGQLSNQLVIDVLSVKEYPYQILSDTLPNDCDILLTHPMFGPDSCQDSNWTGQPMVYYPVRITNSKRLAYFLSTLHQCQLTKMLPSTHDKITARSQCISHFVGRSLSKLGLSTSKIDTLSYQKLCHVTQVTQNDSQDLFYGLINYNQYAKPIIRNFVQGVSHTFESLDTTPA